MLNEIPTSSIEENSSITENGITSDKNNQQKEKEESDENPDSDLQSTELFLPELSGIDYNAIRMRRQAQSIDDPKTKEYKIPRTFEETNRQASLFLSSNCSKIFNIDHSYFFHFADERRWLYRVFKSRDRR